MDDPLDDRLIDDHSTVENDDDDTSPLIESGLVCRGSLLYQLDTRLESLDYEIPQSIIRQTDQHRRTKKSPTRIELERWVCCFLIGLSVGITGILITVSIDILGTWKIKLLQHLFHGQNKNWAPEVTWISINFILVLFSSLLCVYLAPVAAGSGIPQIKCFLNGVKIPKVIRLRALFVKFVGIITAVVGGLAVGKEGPMVHCGAVLAGGLSQGQSISLKFTTRIFQEFRDDHEKRDFVAAGAAAGVSAAFGAPVGGVLFALEEAASFWNQALTWRIFFTSVISFITLDFGLSAFKGEPGNLTSPGLLNFGHFDDMQWFYYELPIFAFMGIIGGLLGAFFVLVNKNITMLRSKLGMSNIAKATEASLIAVLSACCMIVMLNLNQRCRKLEDNTDFVDVDYKLQMNCPDGYYNTMSFLCFGTPEVAVKALFHKDWDYFHITSLSMFFPFYWILAVITYGVAVPSGLFVPALLCGATWGRMIGLGLNTLSVSSFTDAKMYALVGAAAGLGGTVRMTLSLCVILLEATGNMALVLPITVVLVVSKSVGDFFNDGIYDTHIHLWGVPILEWEPPPKSDLVEAKSVMSSPPVVFKSTPTIRDVVNVLSSKEDHHNGFPVVDSDNGKFIGLILRSHLLLLLKNKKIMDPRRPHSDLLDLRQIRDSYPRFFPISNIDLTENEMSQRLDLRPYLNQNPSIVQESSNLEKIFRQFRALGLRHLVVIDSEMKPTGIITRKDISRFRKHRDHTNRLPINQFQSSTVIYD